MVLTVAEEEEEFLEVKAQIFKEEKVFQAMKAIQIKNKIRIQEEVVTTTKGEVTATKRDNVAIKEKEDVVILNAIIAINLVMLLKIARTSNTRLA